MSEPVVLVVDDSEITRAILARSLSRAGFRVVEAEDGVQGAVAALRETPTVVVTDLEMPVMDGCQLARLLKNDPATADVPVVILTSHTEATSRFWGEDSGADAYVTKDELDKELIPTVERLVAGAAPVSATRQQAPSGQLEVLARVARQLDQGLMEMTLINQVLQIGMEKGSFAAAARSLLEFVSRLIDGELLAIAIVDERGVRVHLHRPQGSASSVGLDTVVQQLADQLEARGREIRAVQIDGELEAGEAWLDIDQVMFFDLPLRDAGGCLAVWPRNPEAFAGLARCLLAKSAPHAALVLDNVRLAETLWTLSTHDELTDLLNHRAIVARLNEEVARAQRYQHPLSAILCDIDRFKAINDSLGHPTGDTVLREVARRLRDSLRSSDVVGRYGGEEFLVILPNTGLEPARRAAARLCDALAGEPVPTGAESGAIRVTASFGVACGDEVAGTSYAEGLVSLADTRLYEAKAAGRCCVRP